MSHSIPITHSPNQTRRKINGSTKHGSKKNLFMLFDVKNNFSVHSLHL
jgi:hypothetical protein